MDYDYGQEQTQFHENSVAYNGEEEEEVEYYDETQQQQQQIEVGGNGRNQFSNRDGSLSNSSSSQGKLFVGGVAWETTSDTFTQYFGKYGEITDAIIMTDRHSGRPRGFGFVTFADPAVADRVLVEEHVIDGRTVEVKRTVPREEMDTRGIVRAKKIFVGGILPSLESDELKEYFSNYGNVVDCQIMIDHKTGRSRGFGFVTFDSEDSVQEIFSEGKTHELGGKRVEIKTAVPKRNGDFGLSAKSDSGFSNRSGGYDASNILDGMYAGKMGRGYGAYNGFGGYNNGYGSYAGGYGTGTGFYGGYGGYCYGYGYGGPMMFGGGGYGASSGYGSIAGYDMGRGYGRSNGSNRGNSGSENGGSSATSRYHPYQK